MKQSLLRLPTVIERVGLPKSTIYALISRGHFPAPVKLYPGGRAVAWYEQDINDWIESRQQAS